MSHGEDGGCPKSAAIARVARSILGAAMEPEFVQASGVRVRYCLVVISEECDCAQVLVSSPDDAREAARMLTMSADAYEQRLKSRSPGDPS